MPTNDVVLPVERRWLIYVLLALASIHCARSIFFVNLSLIDLTAYEQGTESMPFQGRVAMMPVLRWAHSNGAIEKAAGFFDRSLRKTPHMQTPPETYSPEKLVCMLLGVVAIGAMVAGAAWSGRRRLGEMWWTAPVAVLAILYVSYAARYEAAFWYPYDLTHFAAFGLACLCLLEDWMLAVVVLFLIDVPLRETSVYLVPVVLALGVCRGKLKSYAMVAAGMVAVWVPVHILIGHHFAQNASDTRVHWLGMGRAIANPLHWPQLASAFGFLVVPLFLGRKFLTREQRWFLLGAAPCLALTALFGIWYESRIWDEWTVPVAMMLGTEVWGKYGGGFNAGSGAISNSKWWKAKQTQIPAGMTNKSLQPKHDWR